MKPEKPEPWEPAVGDVVQVAAGQSCAGDIGEVEMILPQAIGVRIVQQESEVRGQLIYFHAGQLEHVPMKSITVKRGKHVADD